MYSPIETLSVLNAGAILEYFALLREGVSVVWIQSAFRQKKDRVESPRGEH